MPPKKRSQTTLVGGADADKRFKPSSPLSHQEATSSPESLSMESETTSVKVEPSINTEAADHSMSGGALRPAIWCQDCNAEADGLCVEMRHALTSLRMHRAGQAAPKLQRLQTAATSARKVVQGLLDARDAVQAQLEEWRIRLQQLEDAGKDLLAAAEQGGDLEAFQTEGVELLVQDAASLLGGQCHLQLQVDAGSQWEADLPLEASWRGMLYPLLLRLHRDGGLTKVYRSDECMDVETLSKQKDHSQELDDVLQDAGLSKVRKLDDMDCKKRPNWCKVLLQRVAPRVEWLWVAFALREHLDVIRDMPALRYLFLHVKYACGDALDLPLQLEELKVYGFQLATCNGLQLLQSVQRMPNLQKLTVSNVVVHDPVEVTFAPLPAHHRGLRWLCVYLRPLSTALSLAKAHSATLLELRITCSSENDGKTLWYCKDLAEGLRQCGLVALRRVVLMRGPNPGYVAKGIYHAAESCQQQKDAIWDELLAVNATKVVKVFCDICDESCPNFPDLGDFKWMD